MSTTVVDADNCSGIHTCYRRMPSGRIILPHMFCMTHLNCCRAPSCRHTENCSNKRMHWLSCSPAVWQFDSAARVLRFRCQSIMHWLALSAQQLELYFGTQQPLWHSPACWFWLLSGLQDRGICSVACCFCCCCAEHTWHAFAFALIWFSFMLA
jgi:hypothetical protein